MTIIESNPRQLVLRSGSTTVTLDKQTCKATMQRRLLLWSRKPIERQLSEIAEIRIGAQVDRASGVQVCNAMLVMTAGDGWALTAVDKEDATRKVAALLRTRNSAFRKHLRNAELVDHLVGATIQALGSIGALCASRPPSRARN